MTARPDQHRRAAGTASPYRSTTGQLIVMRYEAHTGTLTITEHDWCAQPLRSNALPTHSLVRQRLERRRSASLSR